MSEEFEASGVFTRDGMAVAGFVLGWVGVGTFALLFVLGIIAAAGS